MEEGQQNQPPDANWAFNADDTTSAGMAQAPAPQSHQTEVSWSASEYIAHQKSSGWYVALGLGSVVAAALVWLVTKDIVSASVIVIVSVMFGIFAARQPRVLSYSINHSGVRIGEKFYPFHDFKSFSVMDEEQISSILLIPMKRFWPGLSMYYPPDEENKIIDVISNYLPHEERPPDPLDRLMKKVRF